MERHPSMMTPAERLIAREAMGLTVRALAKVLDQSARNVHRWEEKGKGISAPNAAALARLIDYTDQAVAELVERSEAGTLIITYRTDREFQEAEPHPVWPDLPAQWHRVVARRAAAQIPDARVDERDA